MRGHSNQAWASVHLWQDPDPGRFPVPWKTPAPAPLGRCCPPARSPFLHTLGARLGSTLSSDIFLLSVMKAVTLGTLPTLRASQNVSLQHQQREGRYQEAGRRSSAGVPASLPRDALCFPQGPRYLSLPASQFSYSSPKAKRASCLSPYPWGVKVVGPSHKQKSASCSSEVSELSCCCARGDEWP